MYYKNFSLNRIVLVLIFFCFQQYAFSQNKVDSLLDILSGTENKAKIYNLLSEATLEDSLELSFDYAQKAFDYSIRENNLQQKGVAYFNMAEVFSYQYQFDSAKYYYAPALDIFKKTNDNYNASYALNNLGYLANTYGQFQNAVDYYIESLDYLDKEKYADDLSHIYVNIGNTFHLIGKYETAIKYFNMAITAGRSINYEPIIPYAYNGIGLAYKYLANYDSAIIYYKAMVEINKKTGNELALAIDYSNIGALYFQWEQYRQAFDYFNNAKEIIEKKGTEDDLSLILNSLGNVYRAQGKYELALDYFKQALTIDSTTRIEVNMSSRYNNIGELYSEKGNYQEALYYYKLSLALNQKMGQNHSIAINLHNIGDLYVKTENYTKAQSYYKQGLQLADSLNTTSTVIEYLGSLSNLNNLSGNYKQALIYQIQYSELKDSIFKGKNQMALADMKTKYDLDKKEKEIVLLNQKNELKEARVSVYKTRLYYLIAGIVIVSTLLIFLFFQFRHKEKAYRKLVEKNQKLLKSNGNNLSSYNTKSVNNNSNTKLPDSEQQIIQSKLRQLFANDKIYLNKNLTEKDVAKKIETNTHYLSQVINNCFNTNFTGFINEHRIIESCCFLCEPDNANFTIEGIAQMSGFKSKSAFNNAFKSITGVTPSYYRKLSAKNLET
ncbi:MAG: AraC family transcriptional regulator [Bacteroidales bacterium]|nr:AraC family transcriptional regulator [Bacteroidales bacterium]